VAPKMVDLEVEKTADRVVTDAILRRGGGTLLISRGGGRRCSSYGKETRMLTKNTGRAKLVDKGKKKCTPHPKTRNRLRTASMN